MNTQAANTTEFRKVENESPKLKEKLCNIAAAELLMPEKIFKQYLKRLGISLHTLEWIANAFNVSVPAAAIRIAEVSEELCIAVQWQPKTRNGCRILCQAWCAGPGRRIGCRINALPIVPYMGAQSIVMRAYDKDTAVKSTKLFRVGNSKRLCLMESKGFGQGDTRYVLSLAFPRG